MIIKVYPIKWPENYRNLKKSDILWRKVGESG
jgi:hypothetical protein